MPIRILPFVLLAMALSLDPIRAVAAVEEDTEFSETCQMADPPSGGRIVCADLVAIEQTLVYNRFGSFNPYGMIFALRRDVVPGQAGGFPITADYCATLTGAEGGGLDLKPGDVRLKDCKRPRPVTLRVNVGDHLLLRVENLLTPINPPNFSRDFCRDLDPADEGRRRVRIGVRDGDGLQLDHGEADCLSREEIAAEIVIPEAGHAPDWPQTRLLNLVAQGLQALPDPETGAVNRACRGLDAVAPGESFLCYYSVDQEGTYFFASMAAPAGGEGDGGSIVHGLFGGILAERQGSHWYRSQITSHAMDVAWGKTEIETDNRHARDGAIDYEVTVGGIPVLNMAQPLDAPQEAFDTARYLELVHSDLNAIIWCNNALAEARQDCRADTENAAITTEPAALAFREFSVFFHDELKTFYTRNFRELGQLGQLAGVKDGFAINYGASGMGSILLANRKGIGPSADCMECLYEEFFLASWANGDPALLEWFSDDPSNVHHSYLNDPVVFRNFHAGPKETHVFHLHAHQWFAGNDPNRGSYLDSQTVAPQQGFTYNIYHGGLRGLNGEGKGWWDTSGSGNRNRTIGDSIFHCHLYPHFAQGMWALWRVHDNFEDGTRKLPDGQGEAGLSLDFVPRDADNVAFKRAGSVNRETGAWQDDGGTPIPALVPLPGEALPLLPTYATESEAEIAEVSMPGYPFYIAGQPGHRPPQAPLDIARDLGPNPGATIADGKDGREAVAGDAWLSAGLNRHVVADGSTRTLGIDVPETLDDGTAVADLTGEPKSYFYTQVVAKAFALGDLSGHMEKARVEPLSPWGTNLERAAMGFHFDGNQFAEGGGVGTVPLKLETIDGLSIAGQSSRGVYTSLRAPRPDGVVNPDDAAFYVNGSAPKPGAPFADPCGTAKSETDAAPGLDPLGRGWLANADFFPDPLLDGFRRYEVSAVQLDLIVNSAGWHDPQARINVLTAESDSYKDGPDWRISPVISDSEEPFFFRALSGECIEFRHTNELPKELELDDFQVKTPTDTVGQHIHLVKFDVTSSDGSGNGWNYEDGTFAADETAGRLCAWQKEDITGPATAILQDLADRTRAAMTPEELAGFPSGQPFCEWSVYKSHNIWRMDRNRFPFLFQTTTQRWFADPILSDDGKGAVDRTMRTVFSHDHFGPSSIQQHGFYSALVIEPPARLAESDQLAIDPAQRENYYPQLMPPGAGESDRPLIDDERLASVAWGGTAWEGARKRVIVAPDSAAANLDPDYFQHPNYREYMLSIADFALLYDPRDRKDPLLDAIASKSSDIAGGMSGMERLYCEAYWRLSPALLDRVCGAAPVRDKGTTSYYYPGEVPPAFIAAGAYRDDVHRNDFAGDLFSGAVLETNAPEVADLGLHLLEYRQKAAGTWSPDGGDVQSAAMAQPVAGPVRPESISVDHHDPYLVNYRGAPIPLRIGTKNADGSASNDCAPMPMNRQGETGPSEVITALENGSFGHCSVTHQRTDEAGGDIGEAFASRTNGDPETPLLEAYQGERLVIRMIQGAQEVQHMFSIAGQPLKRNIDQHWPQGMQPLGVSQDWADNPTLQSACFERAAIVNADPREYALWRDTAPSRWDDVGLDEVKWKAYQDALQNCDNIEGFTYAQEIGISEHFEMQGSLRADVNASAEFAPPSTLASADVVTETKVPLGSSDYFYSFGTADALWNGAWGLVRIYKDEDTFDPATLNYSATNPVTESSAQIGERLEAVPSFRLGIETTGEEYGSQNGLACPIPLPGKTQRVVDAVVAAVETRRAFPDQPGTVYGDGLYDPDGLFLALLSPDDLGLYGLEDPSFETIPSDVVLSAIASTYAAQPDPFVLRVTAGDCLRIRIINLLGQEPGNWDHLGDAVMPPIVPLNVDPKPEITARQIWAGSSITRDIGILHRPEGLASGVRPTSKLALNFGLPGLDLILDTPQGFGYNADALSNDNRVSDILVSYAGRFRMDLPEDRDDARSEIARLAARNLYDRLMSDPNIPDETSLLGVWRNQLNANVPANLSEDDLDDAVAEVFGLVTSDAQSGLGSILGDPVMLEFWDGTQSRFEDEVSVDGCPVDGCVDDPETLNLVLSELVDGAIRTALNERTHWIPYAFGATPVRPLADPIGQVPHGLFGAVDVVPQNWTPAQDSGLRCDPVTSDGYERCTATYVAPEGYGQPFLWTASDQDGKEMAVREFVLFWRDGMNLWDDNNAPPWRWSDAPEFGSLGNMVPDCPVCDDSYDRGEAGVSNTAASFSRILADRLSPADLGPDGAIYRSDDLNKFSFPADYLLNVPDSMVLRAAPNEQVVIRVIHPGGRARQRAFAVNGYSYDDLFPGFGFPRSALLAPGKSITAWLRPLTETGTMVWHDGPAYHRAAGAWGLLNVEEADE